VSQPARLARFTALPLATLALTLSACARPTAGIPSGGASGAEASSSASAAAVPSAPSPRATSPTPSATGCPDSLAVVVRAQQAAAQVCLAVGGTLRVSSEPSARQPWQPLSTSDGTVLSCASSPGPDGTIDATCRALRPGTVTVSTYTAPFPGDPQGPQQYLWRLVVTVAG
jgi:hypothetical protein